MSKPEYNIGDLVEQPLYFRKYGIIVKINPLNPNFVTCPTKQYIIRWPDGRIRACEPGNPEEGGFIRVVEAKNE